MSEPQDSGTGKRPSGSLWRVLAAVLVAVAVAFAAGMLLGSRTAGDDATAGAELTENSVDVGFARDMRDHHAQAVEMSVLVREATSSEDIRVLALDVLLTQQQQLGQMYGWLAAWGKDQTSTRPPMTWMTETAHDEASSGNGHDMESLEDTADPVSTARMPGMATPEQLRRLEQLRGVRAERLYLQLMIPHHQAGVDMARSAADRASQPQVRHLARSIVEAQTAELDLLRSMLAARGGPLPAS